MEEDGIGLAEMNKLLLQTVEELTLYVIDQNKKIKDQYKEMNKKEQNIKDLSIRLLRVENN